MMASSAWCAISTFKGLAVTSLQHLLPLALAVYSVMLYPERNAVKVVQQSKKKNVK
jgi:hypothetical protein